MYSSTKSQVLSVDARDAIRQVIVSGVPMWRDVASGRTFPQVAGAEDPPPDTNTGDTGDDEHGDASDDAFDKDRALKTIKQQREREKATAATLKATNAELAALKAKQKERDEAELSESEKLKARNAELEANAAAKDRELQETRNRHEVERAATKAGLADPEDAHSLLKASDFEHDESGNITNADKLVSALLKSKPYLAGKTTANGVPGTPRSNGTQTHEDRVKENIDKLKASGIYDPL